MARRKSSVALGFILLSLFLILASTPTQAMSTAIFDDMEHGNPSGNGWFTFNGAGGGGIGPNSTDLPPLEGGNYSLETGWGAGGAPGFFGGFGRSNPLDLEGLTHFTFWINPDPAQDYTLEINLQEDDNNDNAINQPDDDEFPYNCAISATGPCAVAGGGRQLVSIPLKAFYDDNSFLFAGNGILDPVPASGGGNGQLINVVIAVTSNSGADVTFRTDNWIFADRVVEDLEGGLPLVSGCAGIPLGFCTFQGSGSSVALSTAATPPAPAFPANTPNTVLQVDIDSTSFAGFIQGFTNAAGDTWESQDWSAFGGFAIWLYGNSSGSSLFIDLLENRNPGSTTDDAERWSVTIPDDFSGWRYLEFPFSAFVRKDVGNGAPNDGLTLQKVHGWAFGALGTGGARIYILDDSVLFGVAEVPERAVTVSAAEYVITEGDTARVTVSLTRGRGAAADAPAAVSVDYSIEPGSAIADRDYTPVSGTLTFAQGDPTEKTFTVPTFDNAKHDGDKTAILRLSNPADIATGFVTQSVVAILDDDPLDRTLLDDFERGAFLWYGDNVTLSTPEIAAGDPLALPGQGAYERVLEAQAFAPYEFIVRGRICNNSKGVVRVALLTTDSFDALSVDHNTVRFGDAAETHRNKKTGLAIRHETDFDRDGDRDLVFHFRAGRTGYECDTTDFTLTGETFDGQSINAAAFGRDFPIGQNWTRAEALSFWFYGTNSGDPVTVQIKDNRTPDPGTAGWGLVWSDELNEEAGTPPNPANWGYEIGDGAANRIPGWGNSELQYYTDSTENAATDGAGNLVITASEADGSLTCYYGPCDYTSARLISRYKAEFAYGRLESRILVPEGAGLWPAFWSLGTDIAEVGWPQTGEIDFMEFVGRLPDEIFGTIHGPGYSGGQSFGNIYDFGEPVFNGYHTFAVEWEPNLIEWYVDDILYHTATPADVAPNPWVFNDPVFLLLNVAIGGNFGGPVGPDTTFPQSMKVDYVRVYQGPDTAERWEATFADDFEGWQQITIPFASLTRSADQPVGAPDDGLNLNEVWGYGFELPEGADSALRLDQVRLELLPPPAEITVTNLNDSGAGSLRQALEDIAIGGTITFEPGLAGGTLALASGPLVPAHNVTINGSDAPDIRLSGGDTDRVLIINAGLDVTVAHLTITNGYGYQLAGGILNNGALVLDHVAVTDNTMTTDAGDFWQGGGGIYNGDGATLHLEDSSVVDNSAGWAGGGIYSFFNTTTVIERSTISGNVASDVGGGLRLLGNATIINSTISGNETTGWYGGALFVTDGVVDMTNVTVAGNVSPGSTPAAVFVGTFGPGSATLNVTNSIIAGNANEGCFLAPFGSGAVAINSLGNNVFTDSTCSPIASDQIVADALLDPLADNGGPTLTHALLADSPAIDAGNNAVCPATDQRGLARPQGADCDAGAYELMP